MGVAFTVSDSDGRVVFDSRTDFPDEASAIAEKTVYLPRN